MFDLRPASGARICLQLHGLDEGLEVRVVDSPVGEDAAAIVLQRIDDLLRMVSQPTFHEDVGQGLFRALFPGRLTDLYRAAFAQAASSGQSLTIELRFDRELVRIARYPWELLHDGTRFLLQAGAVNLARYMTFPEPPRPLTARSPLDILVVSARPKDQPPLVSEFEALQKAFDKLISEDKLDLAFLMPPTWDSLMEWLLAGAPSILHFEGHGAFTRTGLLIFEDADGASDPVEASTLGGAFYGTDLRLAVLSACDSAKTAGDSLLSSVAPALILAGVPAVVAMQQRIPDEAATRFSRGFYTALMEGQDLESAVAAGRKQLMRSTYWYVPTLYLRTRRVPEITRAFIERRVDSAGPRRAPVNMPLRFGAWVRRLDAPVPDDDELRRLLGLEPKEDVTRDATRARIEFPVAGGQFLPGEAEVRITATNCEVHGPALKPITIFADFDTPPVWFPLTPRKVGRCEVMFEVTQNGKLIASTAHTLLVSDGTEGVPQAAIQSSSKPPERIDEVEAEEAIDLDAEAAPALPAIEDVLARHEQVRQESQKKEKREAADPVSAEPLMPPAPVVKPSAPAAPASGDSFGAGYGPPPQSGTPPAAPPVVFGRDYGPYGPPAGRTAAGKRRAFPLRFIWYALLAWWHERRWLTLLLAVLWCVMSVVVAVLVLRLVV